jgi:hypothetical protein
MQMLTIKCLLKRWDFPDYSDFKIPLAPFNKGGKDRANPMGLGGFKGRN